MHMLKFAINLIDFRVLHTGATQLPTLWVHFQGMREGMSLLKVICRCIYGNQFLSLILAMLAEQFSSKASIAAHRRIALCKGITGWKRARVRAHMQQLCDLHRGHDQRKLWLEHHFISLISRFYISPLGLQAASAGYNNPKGSLS